MTAAVTTPSSPVDRRLLAFACAGGLAAFVLALGAGFLAGRAARPAAAPRRASRDEDHRPGGKEGGGR